MNPGKARAVTGRMMAYREARLEKEPNNTFVRDEWDLLVYILGMINAYAPPDARSAERQAAASQHVRETARKHLRERCTCERCPVHSKKEAAE
jgi:hypothetical protein